MKLIQEIVEFIAARPGIRGVVVPREAFLAELKASDTLPLLWQQDCATISYGGVPIILDADADGLSAVPVKLAIFGGTGIGESLWESE